MHATSWMNAYSLIQWSIGDHQHQTMASSSIWHIAQNGMSHSNAFTCYSFFFYFYFLFSVLRLIRRKLPAEEQRKSADQIKCLSVFRVYCRSASSNKLPQQMHLLIHIFLLFCTAQWSALTPLLLTTRTECAVRRENAVAFPSALVLLQFISKIKLIYNKCSRIQWESNYSVYYCVKNVLRGTAIFASKL